MPVEDAAEQYPIRCLERLADIVGFHNKDSRTDGEPTDPGSK